MILTLHIAGGVATLATIAAVFIGSIRQWNIGVSKPFLPLLALAQTVTGIALLVSGGGLIRICLSGTVYLSLTVLAYLKVKRFQVA